MKLKILRIFIPSQFNFDLRIYDFAYTWIEQNLDQHSVNAVNEWLELPNGTCTAEFLQLPMKQGGYGIPSMKTTAQRLRLSLRFRLKHNIDDDLRDIWLATSCCNTQHSKEECSHPSRKHSDQVDRPWRHWNSITMSCSLPDVNMLRHSSHRHSSRKSLRLRNLCQWRKTESEESMNLSGSVLVKQTHAEQLQSSWRQLFENTNLVTCRRFWQQCILAYGFEFNVELFIEKRWSFGQATVNSVHFAAIWRCQTNIVTHAEP